MQVHCSLNDILILLFFVKNAEYVDNGGRISVLSLGVSVLSYLN